MTEIVARALLAWGAASLVFAPAWWLARSRGWIRFGDAEPDE